MNCDMCSFYYEDNCGVNNCHYEGTCASSCDDCDDEVPFWSEREDDCLGE